MVFYIWLTLSNRCYIFLKLASLIIRARHCEINQIHNKMNGFKNPYISRARIKNFRNFLDVDVTFDHKQVVIGENNTGKTNFLRAIQLILDKDFSDNDRTLIETDFHESLTDPMVNGEEIEIIINIRGHEHNSKLIAQFSDALVESNPPTLEFRYHYFPNRDHNGNILSYKYEIFKGKGETKFTSEDRNFINIYVIKALRDVERELKANKNSPLYKLVKKYDIQSQDLEGIAELMKAAADQILDLDEIAHIKKTIEDRFTTLSGLQTDNEITLRTFDMDMERLLYSIQVYMGISARPISELSLGLANILYVSLMLLLLKDRTIPPMVRPEKFAELSQLDQDGILDIAYQISTNGNYIIADDLDPEISEKLYAFMDGTNTSSQQSFTILAVEEPEAHLHPILQRLIYREVLHKSTTSVIFTSHSTFIAAVAPLSSIVHLRRSDNSSNIYSSSNIDIDDTEKQDIERYMDAKRGEIYFGKGVVLVEGITEEYIIPASAELIGETLDDSGIIVCNIHSTNFKPYLQILTQLHIPWILFTDGDYYVIEEKDDEKTGEKSYSRKYHIFHEDGATPNYRGNEIIVDILSDLKLVDKDDVPENFADQDKYLNGFGCYIGEYTLEVDMLKKADKGKGINTIKKIYADMNPGAKKKISNFNKLIDNEDYWTALTRIEQNISKGRFAQRLAGSLSEDLIPHHISKGIGEIISKVKEIYE